MNERILFVDDDANILEAYERKLQHVLRVRTAQGPYAGLREIQEKGPFAVVVADMNMPIMNGVEFLKKVHEISPDTVRMMLTGNADIRVAMDAVNEGNVFRFLTKPCPSNLMGSSLVAAIEQYRLVTAERELLEGTLKGAVELLTEILSWVSPQAFGRTLQLRNTVRAMAAKLAVKNTWEVDLAATLSQLGMMAVPQEILAKISQGVPLAPDEARTVDSIPAAGHDLIERIPRMSEVARIVLYQHKRFDGNGFPQDDVKGKDIPLGARILKAASDFHELRDSGVSRQDALKEMNTREGWYDPAIMGVVTGEASLVDSQVDPSQVATISFHELRAGLVLASAIQTGAGKKLIEAGTAISEAVLVRLKKYAETNTILEPISVVVRK